MLTQPDLVKAAAAQKITEERGLLEMMVSMGDAFDGVIQGQGRALKSMAGEGTRVGAIGGAHSDPVSGFSVDQGHAAEKRFPAEGFVRYAA